MGEYIRNICIFVCLCDFISQLLASEKFMGLYKNISGIFIILFLLYPLGKQLIDLTDLSDGILSKRYEENLKNSEKIWSTNQDDLKEQSQRLLEHYANTVYEEWEEANEADEDINP